MAFKLYGGLVSKTSSDGLVTLVAYGPMLGGFITNPATNVEQGAVVAEPLYVSFSIPSDNAFALQPGETFSFPEDLVNNVYAYAATPGHRFSIITLRQRPDIVPLLPNMLVTETTMLLDVILSYLYQQYNDDDDLLSFVMAYNDFTQLFIDWFNTINLPVYTGGNISGALLDWVAEGLYGLTRPLLPAEGSLIYNTDDDNFKRMLTWALFKADGKVFDMRWLKRRIVRYLNGINGTSPNVDSTYQVSVTLGLNNQVNINIGIGRRTITGGALFNQMLMNGAAFNEMQSTFVPGVVIANASILKAAIADGVLELPFQFNYVIGIL